MIEGIQTYRLIFRGEIRSGEQTADVKKKLGRMLKLDPPRTERLFSGPDRVLKKGADLQTAERVQAAFARTGAFLRIEKEIITESHSQTAPHKRSSQPVEKSSALSDLAFLIIAFGVLCLLVFAGTYFLKQGLRIKNPFSESTQKFSTRANKKSPLKPQDTAPLSQTPVKRRAQFWQEIKAIETRAANHLRNKQYDKALPFYEERLNRLTAKFGKGYRRLPAAIIDLAFVLGQTGRAPESERLYLKAIRLAEKAGDGESGDVAAACEGLAALYLQKGQLLQIDPLYQRAIKIRDRLHGAENRNTLALKEKRIILLEKIGRDEEADVLRHYVQSIRRRQFQTQHQPQIGEGRAVPESGSEPPPEEAHIVPVSILDTFRPIEMTIPAISVNHPPAASTAPGDLVKTPQFRGDRQKYGQLMLGTAKEKSYRFVLDIKDNRILGFYFDANQNRDLTDDRPYKNMGTGIFGARIELPMNRVMPRIQTAGAFKIWFYTNAVLWKKGLTRHYSLTQMRGKLTIRGRTYTAYIAERGLNDGDFSNDGLYLDLDGDGKINPSREHFKNRQSDMLEGQPVWFDIQW